MYVCKLWTLKFFFVTKKFSEKTVKPLLSPCMCLLLNSELKSLESFILKDAT